MAGFDMAGGYIGYSPTTVVKTIRRFVATAGQTVFSGADADGKTLSIQNTNPAFYSVYHEGSLLDAPAITVTSSSVTLATGANAGDTVLVESWGSITPVDVPNDIKITPITTSQVHTLDPKCKFLVIEAGGGGGSGAGADSSSSAHSNFGGGGDAGGYVKKIIRREDFVDNDVTDLNITIGSGGATQTSDATGNDGSATTVLVRDSGASTVYTLTAAAGSGGARLGSTSIMGTTARTTKNTSSGGDVNRDSIHGGYAVGWGDGIDTTHRSRGGDGADHPFGSGGQGAQVNSTGSARQAGDAATGYCAGGGGAVSTGGSAVDNGGAGGAGVVYVTEILGA